MAQAKPKPANRPKIARKTVLEFDLSSDTTVSDISWLSDEANEYASSAPVKIAVDGDVIRFELNGY